MESARLWRRLVLGAVGVIAGGGILLAPALAPPAAATGRPVEYGAAAQGKAIHQNYNVVASLDPALASSRATAGVSPDGAPPIQLSSYGYSNDPGTLAGAVLFAPGNPTTTSNFPGLAEAFYPVPANQTHVAKCALNNDASDSTRSGLCDQTRTNTEYALADVQPKNPLGPSAEGFASVAGTTFGQGIPLVADHVTSQSLVVPDAKGELTVLQENKGTNITIPGTPLTVASFEVSAHLLSTTDAVSGDATCRIDMVIAGQHVPVSQVQAALDALPQPPTGGGIVYSFTPPTKPVVAQDNVGAAASCTGAVLEISSPTTGNSVSYTFGETDARAARLGQTLTLPALGVPPITGPPSTPVVSSAPDMASTAPSASTAPAGNDVVSTTPTGATATLAAPPASPGPAAATNSAPSAFGGRLIVKRKSAVPIGVVTGIGATSILLGAWALVGAVGAIAKAGGVSLARR